MAIKMFEELDCVLRGSELPLFEKAVTFAAVAHCGITRKGNRIPYLTHPVEAAAIMADMTDDQELIAVAVLHDVLEDTEVTLQEIAEYFGERVAYYVDTESEDKRSDLPPEDTWMLRKEETIAFLRAEADQNTQMLVLADKLSNMRSVERDVRVLGDGLWERFHQKDKALHGWLYRSIAEALSDLKEYPAWQEYDRLIKMVFEKD